VRVGFGVDLGAYGRRRGTAIVAACRCDAGISLHVLEGTVFDKFFRGRSEVGNQLGEERKLLRSLRGRIAVDVPLDLQNLSSLDTPNYAWQLTLRSVDRAFKALPPLASFLGHCVARFQVHFRAVPSLLETYPAASLRLCGSQGEHFLERFLDFSPDERDAALCALVAVAEKNELLQGDELLSCVRKKLSEFDKIEHLVPQNYVLLKSMPAITSFDRKPYDKWVREKDRV